MTGLLAALLLALASKHPPIEHAADVQLTPVIETSLYAAIDRDRLTPVVIRIDRSEPFVLALVFGKAERTAGICRGPVAIYAPNGDGSEWQRLPPDAEAKLSYAIVADERIAIARDTTDADLKAIVAAVRASAFAKSRITAIILESDDYATVRLIAPNGESGELQAVRRDGRWSLPAD